jgi:hypothetical protein
MWGCAKSVISTVKFVILFGMYAYKGGPFPRTENFPKISLLKVEIFQLQNIFPTENLCRPITFYKIFFLRKIFLRGNPKTVLLIYWNCKVWSLFLLHVCMYRNIIEFPKWKSWYDNKYSPILILSTLYLLHQIHRMFHRLYEYHVLSDKQ